VILAQTRNGQPMGKKSAAPPTDRYYLHQIR
jgi:hypothetical protein